MWTALEQDYGVSNTIGGSPLTGVTLCPQSMDVCDKNNEFKTKAVDITNKGDSSVVTMGNQSDK